MKIKNILASILLLSGILVPLQSETIRMGWFIVKPHVFSDDGKTPCGPTIDLFEKIAVKMGCSVEWVGPLPLSRLGAEQKSENPTLNLDGTFLYIKTPATKNIIFYPKKPYFVGIPSVAVRKSNPLSKINGVEDIAGYRIGFVKALSIVYPPFIMAHKDKVFIDDIAGEDWTSRNLAKLLANRLDAVYERNSYTLYYQIALDGISDQVKVLRLPSEPITHYFVFHRNAARFLELYEKAVANMDINYEEMLRIEIEKRAGKKK